MFKNVNLQNGIKVFIRGKDFPDEEKISFCTWGSEFEPITGINHLVEHIWTQNVEHGEGATTFNYMSFDGDLMKIIFWFFNEETLKPKIYDPDFKSYVGKKFKREIYNVANEEKMREHENQNMFEFWCFGKYSLNGDLDSLNMDFEMFYQYLLTLWKKLTSVDVIFHVNALSPKLLNVLNRTFGSIQNIHRTAVGVPRPTFSSYTFPKSGKYSLFYNAYTTVALQIQNAVPSELSSFLAYNPHVKIDRIVNDVLILNLNINKIDYSDVDKEEILNGLKLSPKLVKYNKEITKVPILYRKKAPSASFLPSRVNATKFCNKLVNAVNSNHYVTMLPIDDFEKITDVAVDYLLNTDETKLDSEFYEYGFFLVKKHVSNCELRKFLTTARSEMYCYNAEILYSTDDYLVFRTNTLDNGALLSFVKRFFETDQVRMLELKR